MGTIRIPLHSRKYPNHYALIDEEDCELVSQYRWYPSVEDRGKRIYANAYSGTSRKDRKITRMHRLIVGAGPGDVIDHIDGNGLNNTRANLRIATTAQNLANRGVPSNNRSGYKGVFRRKNRSNWTATIQVRGETIDLGTFSSAAEAAYVYDRAAEEGFGEFAVTNQSLGLETKRPATNSGGWRRPSKSGYRGVRPSSKSKKWAAYIAHEKKGYHLGVFETPEQAARIYDAAAIILHGEAARLNFDADSKDVVPNARKGKAS